MLFRFLSVVCLLSLMSCLPNEGQRTLNQEIEEFGYIPYQTPLRYAGTGTLVGGTPSHLSLITSPQSCFPDYINGIFPTNLRRIDETNLPDKVYESSFSGNARFRVIDFLNLGTDTISAGVNFEMVDRIEMSFYGATIEYMDAIALSEYYNNHMTPICKRYLEEVGFFIQNLKIKKMSFKFYSRDNFALDLDLGKIQKILNISLGLEWEIVNQTNLIIKKPRYIGYHLGRLKAEDEGISLYRAVETEYNEFIFRSVGIFNDTGDNGTIDPIFIYADEEIEIDGPYIFKRLSDSDLIDSFSIYLD